jgi:hypothetical protein
MRVDEEPPPPVFVDASGRRRRWLRRFAYAAGVALALLVLWLSQFGASVRPQPVHPCASTSPQAGCERR